MNWREWEGRTVDGKFVLGNYLGGSDGSAVFRTRVGNGRGSADESAAIKLVAMGGAEAESQLRRWKVALELSHPNLIRILAMGRAAGEGRELLYVVEEFADENLAQIVPERALTAEEVRGMLGPVLAALEYVHRRGMVHGGIKPSNIMAAGDQVKLSSDCLRMAGEVPRRVSPYDAPEAAVGISAASDLWSLGMTLVEVLTRRPPAWDAARMRPPEIGNAVPEPYRGIARCCLEVDPAKRCGIRGIEERLKERQSATPPLTTAPRIVEVPIDKTAAVLSKLPYLLVLALVVAAVLYLTLRPRAASERGERQTSSVPGVAAMAPPSQEQTKPGRSGTTAGAEPGEAKTAAKDEIVQRVMPQVSAGAQRTITGKIKVRVRVKVDAAGHVAQATLKEAGPSKYFARVALEAAKRWRFSAAQGEDASRAWTLLFVFSRARMEVSVARAR
jgi:TonB family protein